MPDPGATTKAHSADRTPSAVLATASADSAAGPQERTASVAGEACAPVVSPAAGSAGATSAALAAAVFTAGASAVSTATRKNSMSHLLSNCKLITFGLLILSASCSKPVKPSAERAAPSAEKTVP